MPHCIIEHSEAINSDLLVPLVFVGAVKTELFKPEHIKVRALTYSSYKIGDNKSDFIHVVLKILSGRTSEQKTKLTKLVLAELKTEALVDCSITAEVVDIDHVSYAKLVV